LAIERERIETDPGAGLDQKLQPGDNLELQQFQARDKLYQDIP